MSIDLYTLSHYDYANRAKLFDTDRYGMDRYLKIFAINSSKSDHPKIFPVDLHEQVYGAGN